MSAQVIDIKTRQIISDGTDPEPVEEVPADQAIRELRTLLEGAYGVIRSERAARALVQAEALVDGLGDAIAAL